MSIAEKLQTIAENEQKVFDAGKKAEYDAFWDSLQKKGEEFIDYGYMFSCREIWTQENIEKVKYKTLKASYVSVMFSNNSAVTDLSAFSIITSRDRTNDVYKPTWSSTFYGCSNLVKSPLIHLGEIGSAPNMFGYCASLEELQTFYDATFARGYLTNSLDLHWSAKLNKKSIVGVIEGASPEQAGQTLTFSLEAVKKAFETSEGALDGNTSSQWLTLIAAKPNWSIALIDKNGNKYTYDNDYIE